MDKYDLAIQALTLEPSAIYESWNKANDPESLTGNALLGHVLFTPVDRTGHKCACLTEVKEHYLDFGPDKYRTEIKNDPRIPSCGMAITVDHLPVFAEWQRRLDADAAKGAVE